VEPAPSPLKITVRPPSIAWRTIERTIRGSLPCWAGRTSG